MIPEDIAPILFQWDEIDPLVNDSHPVPDADADETISLMSKSSSTTPGDVPYQSNDTKSATNPDSHHLDIRGIALLKHMQFYQLWLLLGILTGVGLMTIK